MRSEKLELVIQISENLANETKRLVEFLKNFVDQQSNSFKIQSEIPGRDGSTADLFSRVFLITEIVEKFDESKNVNLTPLALIDSLKNSLELSIQRIGELINHIESQGKSNGGLIDFEYSNFTGQMKNGTNVQFQPQFRSLFDAVESLLSVFYSNLAVLNPTKASYDFHAAANALSEMLDQTRQDHDALRKQISDLKGVATEVETHKKSAESSASETERLKNQSSDYAKDISEYLASATEKQSAITSVHSEASSLSSQVKFYKDDFEVFQANLDKKNESYEEGSENLSALIEGFNGQKNSIQDLIIQSEAMLKSSTVAGLAGHFNEIRGDITKELRRARRAFYLGILFLLISSVPLAMLIFWPVIALILQAYNPEWTAVLKGYSPEIEQTGWQYVAQVIGRFIVLVPAAWFVSFSAIRHSSLFRLREHYTYKYSMAVSVEGFKKQAKSYEDEIGALVLSELAFNPADKLVPSKDIPEAKSPNPIMRFFMEKIDRRLANLSSGSD